MSDDPVENFLRENKFDSISEVVRTVEAYANDQAFRIEVLKNYFDAHNAYSTVCWAKQKIHVDAIEGEEQSIWVQHYLPWTSGRTPDEALAEALSFLSDEHPKSKKAAL